MINYVYQLVSPQVFSVKYSNIDIKNQVLIRPSYLAICHADQRYYWGKRDFKVLKKKLPMALIHECCGKVVSDPTNTFEVGELVVPIPNVPVQEDDIIYENYRKGSMFLSSGYDGFLQEYINMPVERVVSVKGIPANIAAISEFVSVAVHAVTRFMMISHEKKEIIGIWGDGSMSYCVANVLKKMLPNCKIAVIGKHAGKLSYFSFVDYVYEVDSLPKGFQIDHAFECCGGEGSLNAIDDIIHYINPQGTVMLMGVSENKIAINTRDILEKGLSFIGSSRSGKKDFELAVSHMKDENFKRRLETILYEDTKVSSIEDIHRVFKNDVNTPFKTIFEWNL